ncbi:ABC transporter substrate-binding protein [Haloterrigena alkaliphila]|uniref:ABC transporter substrate-binding protein n=1 Tax=Haloterrigena alkaliphila TaxID=2816475 RepID=A0A8A2VIG5_9EURY|nr:ABC transporter substrate-binding protein [Haloterrigena alkaliphila]QSX00175.1 ABC transporter substrate-binding protein [Haloterrigena alkaliphila]
MLKSERRGGRTDGTSGTDAGPGRIDRRTVLKTAAGSGATVSLAGCLGTYETIVGSSTEAEPITVGMLAPNPKSNVIGQSMAQSAQLAVDELNENGGIDGQEVELVVGNTKSSPLEGRRAYQRLILEHGADVTVGVFDSPTLVNLMDEIAEQQTLHLTAGAASRFASQKVNEEYDRYKYHFRVGPTNDADLGRAQINFMNVYATEIGWNSIAVLAEDYPWADKPWEIYQNHLPDTPVDVVYENRYPPSTKDFTEIYTQAARAGADAAFISTAHTGNEALAYWKRGQFPFAFGGIHVPMQVPSYYEQSGGLSRYAVGFSVATEQSEITDKTQGFVQNYAETFGTYPQDMGYYTYDAIYLFAETVESTGTLDTDELIPSLEDVSYTGVSGTTDFYDPDHVHAHDRFWDEDDPTGIYFQWQENDDGEGVREVIWPDEHKTSDYVRPPWI